MPSAASPLRITVETAAQRFVVTWRDGHESAFPLDGLRRACPCAACRGHESMGELPDPELFRLPALMRWNRLKVQPAGSIGVRLVWDDGHNTGIHSWERLRAMCPCAACSGP